MCIDFREQGRERERSIHVREKHWLVALQAPTGDRTHNTGMCPDPGSNSQPFGTQDITPTNGATQPGLRLWTVYKLFISITMQSIWGPGFIQRRRLYHLFPHFEKREAAITGEPLFLTKVQAGARVDTILWTVSLPTCMEGERALGLAITTGLTPLWSFGSSKTTCQNL